MAICYLVRKTELASSLYQASRERALREQGGGRVRLGGRLARRNMWRDTAQRKPAQVGALVCARWDTRGCWVHPKVGRGKALD